MGIIFLDIDGVILPIKEKMKIAHKYRLDYGTPLYDEKAISLFDKNALQLLNAFIADVKYKDPDVRFVVTGAWANRYSVDQLQKIVSERVINKIPELRSGIINREIDFFHRLNRGEEIEYWLSLQSKKPANFLIFSGFDHGTSELFPEQFIKCREVLGQDEIKEAYTRLYKSGIFAKNTHPVQNLLVGTTEEDHSTTYRKTNMRVTSVTRRDCLASPLNLTPLLNENIQSLINDYDTGEIEDNPHWRNCSIM